MSAIKWSLILTSGMITQIAEHSADLFEAIHDGQTTSKFCFLHYPSMGDDNTDNITITECNEPISDSIEEKKIPGFIYGCEEKCGYCPHGTEITWICQLVLKTCQPSHILVWFSSEKIGMCYISIRQELFTSLMVARDNIPLAETMLESIENKANVLRSQVLLGQKTVEQYAVDLKNIGFDFSCRFVERE